MKKMMLSVYNVRKAQSKVHGLWSNATRLLLMLVLVFGFASSNTAFAYLGHTTAELCPMKTLETKRILGKYLGWKYDTGLGGGIVEIGLKDDMSFYVYATKEQAKEFFGTNKNTMARVTYELMQEFSHKTSFCEGVKVLRHASLLEDNDYELDSYQDVNDAQIFYTNTVQGTFVEYWEGSDFNYVDLLVHNKRLSFVCGPDNVLKMFGKNATGKSFLVTYTAERIVFDGNDPFNICLSAKPLP